MFNFDPDRVAYLEGAGWRAYYDRDWIKLLRLVVALNQEQFRIPFPQSLVAAYYVTRASIAWAPVDHDLDVVGGYFERFYRLARRFSGLTFDPRLAATHELRYWVEHRRLVGQADKAPFVDAMTDLHTEIFDLPPERVRESAVWRVEANNTVDRITGGQSQDVEAAWCAIQQQLRACYRSILRELASA